ncbi:Glucosamine 6-phosphate N-acetyltransferase [Mycena venus]|uniref:Glucosamine 6-phosphate N-acetyltransferase n=1 Tax=Mycena venus TaxID=2733690 RepID=A0A8H6Y1T9_9AGAR|nr:Glucosamine 6-phosphate N-acetyltransferase [Mycena venus]
MSKIVSWEIVFGQDDQNLISECHRIRKEVFHLEQKFPLDTEFDDVEHIAYHFLLRVTEQDPASGETTIKSVGTIRGTTPDVYPAINRYKLSRLAVDIDYRKHKFGRLLTEKLHKWIQEDAKATNRPAVVECHSQIPAMGFYAKFGYTPEGEQFDEDGEPHQNMVVNLPLAE